MYNGLSKASWLQESHIWKQNQTVVTMNYVHTADRLINFKYKPLALIWKSDLPLTLEMGFYEKRDYMTGMQAYPWHQ